MPRPAEIVEIDLQTEDLFGWEKSITWHTLNNVVQMVENDSLLPAPWVHINEDGTYFLSPIPTDHATKRADGGHNRAVAHYICGVSLEARIFDGESPYETGTNVRDIRILDDGGSELRNREKARRRRDAQWRMSLLQE